MLALWDGINIALPYIAHMTENSEVRENGSTTFAPRNNVIDMQLCALASLSTAELAAGAISHKH